MDIVIPYRIPPHGTHELQFALRSACEHYDVGRVFLLGDKPAWCTGVVHVPGGGEGRDPIWNVMQKLRKFVQADACPKEFVLWNDDMYVLRDGVDLDPTADIEKTIGQLSERLIGKYKQAAQRTAMLTSVDFESYELHKPMHAWRQYVENALAREEEPVFVRTIYAWLWDIEWAADREPDRLAITADDVEDLMKGPWFASRDTMATAAEFVLPMRARFPDKCRFEV